MAQNDVQFTQFMFNKLGYNPAFAGSDDALTIGGIFREQWVNVEGAPQTLRAHAHTPFFKNKCGIGIALTSDKIGMMQTNALDLSYSYRMPIGKNKLSFGLSGRNHFYVGVSVPQLMNNSNFQYSDLPNNNDMAMRTTYLMAGTEFTLSSKVKLLPTALVSYNPNAPVDVDANLGLMWMNALYTGVSYRLNDSFDFLVMYQVTQQMRLGAAYDFTTSAIKDKTPGSFELMASYTFNYDTDDIKNLRFF